MTSGDLPPVLGIVADVCSSRVQFDGLKTVAMDRTGGTKQRSCTIDEGS
jgi:hypothetical protein